MSTFPPTLHHSAGRRGFTGGKRLRLQALIGERLGRLRDGSRRGALVKICAWLLASAALALLGQGVEGRLSPMTLSVPGSPSARAEAMLAKRFGNSIPLAVLLRGPQSALNAQGAAAAHALQRLPQASVLSTFTGAGQFTGEASHALRPQPDAALLLVSFGRPASAAMSTVPEVQRTLSTVLRPPVHPYITGIAAISDALQSSTLASTERAELIALPVLVLVLLLVFGSPVAAAMPLLMGALTVTAGHGLLWLASFLTPINSLSVAIAAMMSLALGVDYALLMVSRLRQGLAEQLPYEQALSLAARSAGRTIAAAGSTLALTMLAASAVATPGLLAPVAIGVVISGLLSVALALSAMPALLSLLEPWFGRWQFRLHRSGAGAGVVGRLRALAERLIANPLLSAPAILIGMLALAGPALALQMGPPDASELPSSSPARVAMKTLEGTLGPGWSAPFVVVASTGNGPLTSRGRLNAMAKWQETLARQPGVAAVLGPASVAGARHYLSQSAGALAAAPRRLTLAKAGVVDLSNGLHSAQGGLQSLRAGLLSAVGGARSLAAGARAAEGGAGQIARSATGAAAGATRLSAGASQAQSAAAILASSSQQAASAAGRLSLESGRARAGALALSEGARGGLSGAQALQAGLGQAAEGSARLSAGLVEADAGAHRLAASDSELAAGAATLADGMNTLDATVHRLSAPLEGLTRELHTWSTLIASVRSSEAGATAALERAEQQLQAIGTGSGDPRVAALHESLAAVRAAMRQGSLTRLSGLGGQLLEGIEELTALPAQLTQMLEALDRLTAGADRLANGTRESQEGAQRLAEALDQLNQGSQALTGGLGSLHNGSARLVGGLEVLGAGNASLARGLAALAGANHRLSGGLGALAKGGNRLASGAGELGTGAGRLSSGMDRLAKGSAKLAGGTHAIVGGAEELGNGLSGAHSRSHRLLTGLRAARRPLRRYDTMLGRYQAGYRLLHAKAPGTLSSGYLMLAALDGSTAAQREQVSQMVNVDSGGNSVRFIVISSAAPSSPKTIALSAHLHKLLPSLAKATGSTVAIGQGAQYLLDYRNANTARFPLLVLALALVAMAMLVVILRAPLLAALAVALNLGTIAVALGALELLSSAHLLGGPGYIDAASGAGIVSIMFVLSIDYEVFLLMRMREHWLEGAGFEQSIALGLRHTAGVITGSAAIMAAVFGAFAGASVVPLRQFGVGLTIAVLLDATIVRLVLLPALMRIFGPRVFAIPGWLDRHLPAFAH